MLENDARVRVENDAGVRVEGDASVRERCSRSRTMLAFENDARTILAFFAQYNTRRRS